MNYPSDMFEVIYVDAESEDNTLQIIEEKIQLFKNFKCIVELGFPSSGRNKGIIEAQGDIIAFTDADCIVHENWITQIVHYLNLYDDIGGIGGPSYTSNSDTEFSKKIGILWETKFGSAGARNPKQYKGQRFVDHNPTCNSAYRRWIFDIVGYFDEKIPVTEDVELDTRIRGCGFKLLYSDDIIVWHHRKSSLTSFMKQMYNYGYWRAHSGKHKRIPLTYIHTLPSLFLIYLILCPIITLFLSYLWILPFYVYLVFGLISGVISSLRYSDFSLTLIVLFLGFIEHITYGTGFILGLLRR